MQPGPFATLGQAVRHGGAGAAYAVRLHLTHPPLPTSFLDRNAISRVEGLERCPHLEELYVSGQRLKRGVELTFDYASLETIGVSELPGQ